jgi:hypothetical protein
MKSGQSQDQNHAEGFNQKIPWVARTEPRRAGETRQLNFGERFQENPNTRRRRYTAGDDSFFRSVLVVAFPAPMAGSMRPKSYELHEN